MKLCFHNSPIPIYKVEINMLTKINMAYFKNPTPFILILKYILKNILIYKTCVTDLLFIYIQSTKYVKLRINI